VSDSPTTHIPQPLSGTPGFPRSAPSSCTAVAACAVGIVSGWATSVVATDLIVGWWQTDRLFCIVIALLAVVFATTTVSGVILMLQRRPVGRPLLLVGFVVAICAYGAVFIAGAQVPWIVYVPWLLPLIGAILALHPRTTRWLRG